MRQATLEKSQQDGTGNNLLKKQTFRENGGFLFKAQIDKESDHVNSVLNNLYKKHQENVE